MNKVGLSNTSGKLFWGSLLGYSLAFGGFYLTTQHTLDQINYEEKQGAFLNFKDSMCGNGSACADISFENNFVTSEKKYETQVSVTGKTVNPSQLQSNYESFAKLLPWYVRMQFNKELVITKINGKQFKAN